MRPLKLGIFLPTFEGSGNSGPGWSRNGVFRDTLRWPDILAHTRHIERAGFDSVWVPDHLLFRWDGDDGPSQGAWDGWSILTALAAATERIELGTLVLCTAFRNPALLAKMADTVDEISKGRLILGLGAGYHEPEFRAFGYPFDHRGARFEEAVAIITSLLRNGAVDFEGAYVSAPGCELRPRGPRPGGPPIMLGGGDNPGPRTVRLDAEHADLWDTWLAFGRSQPDALAPLLAHIDAACADVGRDPRTLARAATIMVVAPGHEPAGAAPGMVPATGSADELADTFRAFGDLGISQLQLVLNPFSASAIEALAPVVRALRADAPNTGNDSGQIAPVSDSAPARTRKSPTDRRPGFRYPGGFYWTQGSVYGLATGGQMSDRVADSWPGLPARDAWSERSKSCLVFRILAMSVGTHPDI